jgi:hypothetical protein
MTAATETNRMKILTDLLPLLAALAVLGGLTWFLLARDMAIGRWLLAATLFGHGWVHVMFMVPLPARTATSATASDEAFSRTFDLGRSWLVHAGLDVHLVRAIGTLLVLVTVVGFMLAALSTVGWLVPAAWWPGLVIGSSVASILLLAVALNPTLILGFGINAVLLWVALASLWTPTLAAARPAGLP